MKSPRLRVGDKVWVPGLITDEAYDSFLVRVDVGGISDDETTWYFGKHQILPRPSKEK